MCVAIPPLQPLHLSHAHEQIYLHLLTTHNHLPVTFCDSDVWQSNKNGDSITFGNGTDCLCQVLGSFTLSALQNIF
jgi:hypothetical protein